IRDFHVTGVPTCALPILDAAAEVEELPLRQGADVGPLVDHPSLRRLEEVEDDVRDRRLARAGLPDERRRRPARQGEGDVVDRLEGRPGADRKSTRLNSSHVKISYAVFCLKKKKNR